MELNEVVAISSSQNSSEKSNLHINKLIFLIPLVLLISNFLNGSERKNNNVSALLDLGSNFLASLNTKSANEKLDVIKKIGPYMPENVVEPLNTIVFYIEKITTILGLMEVVTTNKSYAPIITYDNLTNKEKINGILSTIKEESKDERLNSIKPIIDVALNFDRYKSLIDTISSLGNMNNKADKISSQPTKTEPVQDSSNKQIQIEDMLNIFKPLLGNDENKISQFNSMVNAIKPMLENKESKSNQMNNIVDAIKPALSNDQGINSEKLGDMFKILELLNVLNSKEGKSVSEETEK